MESIQNLKWYCCSLCNKLLKVLIGFKSFHCDFVEGVEQGEPSQLDTYSFDVTFGIGALLCFGVDYARATWFSPCFVVW